MKRLILLFILISLTGYGQVIRTVTPTWVKNIARDSTQSLRAQIAGYGYQTATQVRTIVGDSLASGYIKPLASGGSITSDNYVIIQKGDNNYYAEVVDDLPVSTATNTAILDALIGIQQELIDIRNDITSLTSRVADLEDGIGNTLPNYLTYYPTSLSIVGDSSGTSGAGSTETAFNHTSTTQQAGNVTWRTVIPAGTFTVNGDSIRIKIEGKTTQQNILCASIGVQSSTGDPYDMTGTVTGFRFSKDTLSYGTLWSAKLPITYYKDSAYVIQISTANAYVYESANTSVSGYFKASGEGDSLTANVSGYSGALLSWSNLVSLELTQNGGTSDTANTTLYVINNTGLSVNIDSIKVGSIFALSTVDTALANADTLEVTVSMLLANISGTYNSIVRVYNSISVDNIAVTGTLRSTGGGSETPTIPNAPTVLTATGQVLGIYLSWTDNASDEDGFIIYRSSTSGGSLTAIDSVSSNITSYTNTGLTAGATWYYKVLAYNSVGNSAFTNEANATVLSQVQGGETNVYYFAVNGSSSNSGTQASPYDITKLNNTAWSSGDSLCLMYGNEWTRQTINLQGETNVTLCAKGGTGIIPTLNGGTEVSFTYDPTTQLYKSTRTNSGWIVFRVSDDSLVTGIPKGTLATITDRFDYRYENGAYYIKEPALYHYVTTTDGSILLHNSTGVKVDGIRTICYQDYNIYGTTVTNATIQNCKVRAIGRGYDNLGQGIMLQGSIGGQILNNDIKDTGEHGIYLPVFHDVSSVVSYNNKIKNNNITNSYHTYIDIMNSYGVIRWGFTVTGVSTYPTAGAIYSNNGCTFQIISASGSSIIAYLTAGNEPLASGVLTKASGTGDATITYTADENLAYTSVNRDIEIAYNIIQRDANANPSVGAEGIQIQGRPRHETRTGLNNNYIKLVKVHHNIVNNIGNYNGIFFSWSADSNYAINNTIYGGKGISITDYNNLFTVGTIANNLVYLTGTNWQLWVAKRTSGIISDYNLFYASNGSHFWALSDGISASNLTSWRNSTPFDDNSMYANPLLNFTTYGLNNLSPAIDNGNDTYLEGSVDFYGNSMNGTTDIGAVEKQ